MTDLVSNAAYALVGLGLVTLMLPVGLLLTWALSPGVQLWRERRALTTGTNRWLEQKRRAGLL